MIHSQPLSLGISSFRSLRNKQAVYVDKTDMIRMLAAPSSDNDKWFLARPRRFGKSLLVSTLESLFKYGIRDFEGLCISKDWNDRCYDVVRLDFSEIPDCRNAEAFAKAFRVFLAFKFKPLGFEADPFQSTFFPNLSAWLESRESRSLVLLIDEYDAPLTQTIDDLTLFSEIQDNIRPFFNTVKSQSDCLRFFFITGITKFSNTQVFSGFNELTDISLDPTYGTLLGYTDDELDRYFSGRLEMAAKRLGLSMEKLRAQLKDFYDGFSFDQEGKTHVYSPWSILSFLRAPELGFRNHWYLTAGQPSILLKYLVHHKMSDPGHFNDGVKVLPSSLQSALQYNELEPDILLQQTGYLTIKAIDESGNIELGYPNREVASSLAQLYVEELTRSRNFPRRDIVKALSMGDVSSVVEYFNSFANAIDYQQFPLRNEANCRFLLQMLMLMSALQPQVEVHTAKGRSDLEVDSGDCHWVFELKYARRPQEIEALIDSAVRQMVERRYGETLHGKKLIRVALVFDSDKRRFVAREAQSV